ncbi:unnamed protein product, partial [Leptidea sinapis]
MGYLNISPIYWTGLILVAYQGKVFALHAINIILFSDNVTVEFYGNDKSELKGTKIGRMYLTTHRMIYNSKNNTDTLRSFSFPFIALQDVTVEQPMFGANYIKGKVGAQPNGNFIGEVKFKLTFKSGGAIEFGQAMLKAAHLGIYKAFPDQPSPNSVFVSNSPPPYPGVTGATYPAGAGFSGMTPNASPTGGQNWQNPNAPPPGYPGNASLPPSGFAGGFVPPPGMSAN